MSDFLPSPKGQGVCIRSNLHNFLQVFPFNLIYNVTFSRRKKCLTFLHRLVVCVRAKHLLAYYCMLHSLSFDMQHDHILKKKVLYNPMCPLSGPIFGTRGII